MSVINSTRTKISASKEELKKALAKMITNLIGNKKWSDKEAATELDVKQSMITNLAKGAITKVSMDDILDLFVQFGYKSELKLSSSQDMANIVISKVPIKKPRKAKKNVIELG